MCMYIYIYIYIYIRVFIYMHILPVARATASLGCYASHGVRDFSGRGIAKKPRGSRRSLRLRLASLRQ